MIQEYDIPKINPYPHTHTHKCVQALISFSREVSKKYIYRKNYRVIKKTDPFSLISLFCLIKYRKHLQKNKSISNWSSRKYFPKR